jgi:hypothetical protein
VGNSGRGDRMREASGSWAEMWRNDCKDGHDICTQKELTWGHEERDDRDSLQESRLLKSELLELGLWEEWSGK